MQGTTGKKKFTKKKENDQSMYICPKVQYE